MSILTQTGFFRLTAPEKRLIHGGEIIMGFAHTHCWAI